MNKSTTAFSMAEFKQRAIQTKVKINKNLARMANEGGHPTFKKDHPDWCIDATKGNYMVLENVTRANMKKIQDEHQKRVLKRAGIRKPE